MIDGSDRVFDYPTRLMRDVIHFRKCKCAEDVPANQIFVSHNLTSLRRGLRKVA